MTTRHPTVTDPPMPCGHELLVALAAKLPCMYPRDDCDKHRDEDPAAFARCPMCVCRDEAHLQQRRASR